MGTLIITIASDFEQKSKYYVPAKAVKHIENCNTTVSKVNHTREQPAPGFLNSSQAVKSIKVGGKFSAGKIWQLQCISCTHDEFEDCLHNQQKLYASLQVGCSFQYNKLKDNKYMANIIHSTSGCHYLNDFQNCKSSTVQLTIRILCTMLNVTSDRRIIWTSTYFVRGGN